MTCYSNGLYVYVFSGRSANCSWEFFQVLLFALFFFLIYAHSQKSKTLSEISEISVAQWELSVQRDKVQSVNSSHFQSKWDRKFRYQPEREKIKETFTCNGVEEHEVLKVGDLSPLPALSHVGRLEELTRGGQGNPPDTHTHWSWFSFYHTRKNNTCRTVLDQLTVTCTYLACGRP